MTSISPKITNGMNAYGSYNVMNNRTLICDITYCIFTGYFTGILTGSVTSYMYIGIKLQLYMSQYNNCVIYLRFPHRAKKNVEKLRGESD